jgi:glucose-1-phosphate thymidylyltransferase
MRGIVLAGGSGTSAGVEFEITDVNRTMARRTGVNIAGPEEIAWRRGFLTDEESCVRAERLVESGYGTYLLDLLDGAD